MSTENHSTARSVAIVGAGAIGSWLADALDRAGWRVSLIARGVTLQALRAGGLRVERDAVIRHSRPAAGSAAEVGVQDYIFLSVKAQSLPSLVPQLDPLLGPETVVISATNGIPWWFFLNQPGPLENALLESVDPQGTQAGVFADQAALGSVVHASARVIAPGHVQVVAVDRMLLGDPRGGSTARMHDMVAALRAGGIPCEGSAFIRREIWSKLWGNMTMNPLSALTRAGTEAMLGDVDVRDLALRMMEEMQRCGERLDLTFSTTAVERVAVTRRLGDFRTSMLADLEACRMLEYAPQLGAVVEIAQRLGVPVPFCRSILGLVRLLSASSAP